MDPLTFSSNTGFKAFGMENVSLQLGPTWVEDRVCSGEACDRQYPNTFDCVCLSRARRYSWVVRSVIVSPDIPGGQCEFQSLAFSRIFLPRGLLENPLRDDDIDVYDLRLSMDRIGARINGSESDPIQNHGWTIYGWYKPVMTRLRSSGDGNAPAHTQAVVNEVKVHLAEVKPTSMRPEPAS